MRIAVNTRLLLKDKLEGIGWFAYETLKRITKAHPEHEFVFFFDRPFSSEFVFSKNVKPVVLSPQARHPILFNLWFDYSVTRALKKHKADVFLSPDGMLSLRTNIPQIAVMHDLNFEHYPEDLPPHIAKYYLKRFPLFAKKAQKIITVSEYSKSDLIQNYSVNENNVTVAYNGAGKHYSPFSDEKRKEGLHRINNGVPYFIYVGALHKRKNIERMLSAFKELKVHHKTPLDFIIIGDPLWKKDRQLDKICKDVKFLGRKSGKELAEMVGCSQAMIYVSYFEGFGVPVIEGFKSGVPVVTSNVTSMPEVGGDAAIYSDPFSVASIKEGILMALDSDKWNDYREKGILRAASFNWDNTAEKVWNVIEKTIIGTNKTIN